MSYSKICFFAVAIAAVAFASCSDEPRAITSDSEKVDNAGNGGGIEGFYVLNEGNMGSNKATIDLFKYSTGTYTRNIFSERNLEAIKELGDVGNDIAINNGRLYVVLNGSHKVEVCDAATTRSLGHVNVNTPRFMAFNGNGSVVRFDATTLQVTGTCPVGLQPEEMVVSDGKLYVANSTDNNGTYDDTISIIDLNTFKLAGTISAAINMHHLRIDDYGNMWATSRGNYYDIAGSVVLLQKVDGGEYVKVNEYSMECTNLSISGSHMYYYSVVYDANWNATNTVYVCDIDASGLNGSATTFITDGSDKDIISPYCIAAQPSDGTLLITDAKNYVSSGMVYCYSAAGKKLWSATTGDIPGHIAFVTK